MRRNREGRRGRWRDASDRNERQFSRNLDNRALLLCLPRSLLTAAVELLGNCPVNLPIEALLGLFLSLHGYPCEWVSHSAILLALHMLLHLRVVFESVESLEVHCILVQLHMLSRLDDPTLSQRHSFRAIIRSPKLILGLRGCQFGPESRLGRWEAVAGPLAGISLKCLFISLAHYHDKEKNGGLLNHNRIYKNASEKPAYLPAVILVMKQGWDGKKGMWEC